MIVEREYHAQRLRESIVGRDLVQMALTDPYEIIEDTQLKYTLLGRTIYSDDEHTMVKRITNNIAESSQILVNKIADFDRDARPFPLDAWKLVYCDVYYIDGDSATLQEIYEARLREEELQTPAARARELVRWDELKQARRNAKWMIPAIERLWTEEQPQPDPEEKARMERVLAMMDDKERMGNEKLLQELDDEETLKRIWKRVSPAPPAWIQQIVDAQEQWGFIYYLSRDVDEKYVRNWKTTWNRLISNTCSPYRVTISSIHCQGKDNWTALERLSTENWPIFSPNENLAEDDNLRK